MRAAGHDLRPGNARFYREHVAVKLVLSLAHVAKIIELKIHA
jgi:hypothetical protein